jgi:hypothetical protein
MAVTTTPQVGTALCEDERKLMQAWKIAMAEFLGAIEAYSAPIRTLERTECDKVRAELQRARLAVDDTRLSLAIHRNEHGC